jgi:hypothetical protein
MAAQVLRSTIVTTALLVAATLAVDAQAQCCGATTAFYQPTTVTAFSPVVVQPVQTGWYPGFFLDRIRTRLWGAPNTFVAAQPTTYAVARPVFTTTVAQPVYTTSYAPMTVSPVSTCSTCMPTQQVTMRPVVTYDACSTCSPCSAGGVMQTSYVESSGCTSCGVSGYSESAGTPIQSNGTTAPSIPASEPTPEERSQLKPPAEGTEPPPADESNETKPEDTPTEGASGPSANYFEAPKLFDPKDRTAQRKISPVRTALYEQRVGYRGVSMSNQKITAEQAHRDAAGWSSAAN